MDLRRLSSPVVRSWARTGKFGKAKEHFGRDSSVWLQVHSYKGCYKTEDKLYKVLSNEYA